MFQVENSAIKTGKCITIPIALVATGGACVATIAIPAILALEAAAIASVASVTAATGATLAAVAATNVIRLIKLPFHFAWKEHEASMEKKWTEISRSYNIKFEDYVRTYKDRYIQGLLNNIETKVKKVEEEINR